MQTKKNKSKTYILLTIIFALMGLLLSCSSEEKKLNTYVRNLKISVIQKYSKKQIPPLELKTPEQVSYGNSQGKSPFSQETTEINKLSSPLLIYPVSMLKFVGTVTEKGKTLAYVIAPDTKLYQIGVGAKIGIHHGIVKTITANQVVILEQNPEIMDKGATQIVTLQLKDENQ